MKNQIIKSIETNIRFKKIKDIVTAMSEKYGAVVAAGGSLVDCLFGLPFYDVDLFISTSDLKEEYKRKYTNKGHIKDVLRDEFEGEAIDIIVVDYSVKTHVSRFDQNFKRISYDLQNGIQVADEAVTDLMNNKISLNTMNGSIVFFRIHKSSMKYNMELDKLDLYLLQNYMTVFGVRLSKKYESLEYLYEPLDEFDYTLALLVDRYTETYWGKAPIVPKWKTIRRVARLYMKMFKMTI